MMLPRKIYTVVDPRWWFVCSVSSGKDMIFRRDLAKKGIVNFSPVVQKEIKINGRKPRITNKPLFPGYVFVKGEHYNDFKKTENWKGFLSIINSNENEPYHLAHQVVYNLILNQSKGVYDIGKENNQEISAGDYVDVLDSENSENILFSGGSVLLVGAKKATIICGNKVWKIKLCRIRKSVHKPSPFGRA